MEYHYPRVPITTAAGVVARVNMAAHLQVVDDTNARGVIVRVAHDRRSRVLLVLRSIRASICVVVVVRQVLRIQVIRPRHRQVQVISM